MKRGELRHVAILLTIVILGMFTFMSLPLKFTAGPTGLSFSAQADIAGCAVINESSTLTQDIVGTGTCILIANDSIDFSCGGFTITYDTGGTNGVGINLSNSSNVIIRDCTVVDGSVSSTTSFALFGNQTIHGLITNSTFIGNQSPVVQIDNMTNITLQDSSFIVHSTATTDAIRFIENGDNNTIKNSIISAKGIGIYLNNRFNRTVIINNHINVTGTNNRIIDINGRGNFNNITNNTMILNTTSSSHEGIFINAFSNNNFVMYNRINVSGTSSNMGLEAQSNSDQLTMIGNTIFINCSSSSCRGIFLESNFDNSTILDNSVTILGTNTLRGFYATANVENINVSNNTFIVNATGTSSDGFFIESNSDNITATGNTILVEGTGFTSAVFLQSTVSNNTFIQNTIAYLGTGNANIGLELASNSRENTFIGNRIIAAGQSSGSNNRGLNIDDDSDINYFDFNNFTNAGTGTSYALSFEWTNNTRLNNTRIISPDQWIEVINDGYLINMTNTTFETGNGSIQFFGKFAFGDRTLEITRTKVNISSNRAFVNSTNFTFMNTSARITLEEITIPDPEPIVDFDNDGVFEKCPSTTCTEVSFTGSTYVFDVAQFTSYAAADGDPNVTLAKSDSSDPVNTDSQLDYTITITNNGTANATNLTLTESYPAEVIFLSGSPTPLTGTNTTFVIGNISGGTSVVVNISVFVINVSDGTVLNNTVNITFANATGQIANATVVETTTAQVAAAGVGGTGGGGGYTTPTRGGVKYGDPEYETTPACFESWACEGWGDCEFGYQERECVDLSACGTQNLKPITKQDCEMPVIEQPAPVPVIEKPRPDPKVVEEIVVPEENTPILTIIFLVLVGLGVVSLVAAVLIMHYKK